MSEITEYEMHIDARRLLDEYFDIERGEDLDVEWTDKCREIADVILLLDAILEEKE